MSYREMWQKANSELLKLERERAPLVADRDRYKRFIIDTGKRGEYLLWCAHDLGIKDTKWLEDALNGDESANKASRE